MSLHPNPLHSQLLKANLQLKKPLFKLNAYRKNTL